LRKRKKVDILIEKNIRKKVIEEDDYELDENDDDEEECESGHGKIFLKSFLLVMGIILVIAVLMYLVSYFNR